MSIIHKIERMLFENSSSTSGWAFRREGIVTVAIADRYKVKYSGLADIMHNLEIICKDYNADYERDDISSTITSIVVTENEGTKLVYILITGDMILTEGKYLSIYDFLAAIHHFMVNFPKKFSSIYVEFLPKTVLRIVHDYRSKYQRRHGIYVAGIVSAYIRIFNKMPSTMNIKLEENTSLLETNAYNDYWYYIKDAYNISTAEIL